MAEFQLKDSGVREQFSTGSQRDSQLGKGRYDLLSVLFLFRVAKVLENGAIKYDEDNWRKGQTFKRMLNSAIRHLLQWGAGCYDEDHLAQAACNIMFILETEYRVQQGDLPSELDDRFKPMLKGLELFYPLHNIFNNTLLANNTMKRLRDSKRQKLRGFA